MYYNKEEQSDDEKDVKKPEPKPADKKANAKKDSDEDDWDLDNDWGEEDADFRKKDDRKLLISGAAPSRMTRSGTWSSGDTVCA